MTHRSCSSPSMRLVTYRFLYLIYKRTNRLYLSSDPSNYPSNVSSFSSAINTCRPRKFTSCLTTRECLQSAHTLCSDSMEKRWFSVNDCIRLSSALLTWAIGCEDWKLVGRSVSLDCFHLQTSSSLHAFHNVMRRPFTFGIYSGNYESWLLWSWLRNLSTCGNESVKCEENLKAKYVVLCLSL